MAENELKVVAGLVDKVTTGVLTGREAMVVLLFVFDNIWDRTFGGNDMAKAKLIETWRDDKFAPGGNKRIWIVQHNGQSTVYYTKREARVTKAAIDNIWNRTFGGNDNET